MLGKLRISIIISKRKQMLFVACVNITGDNIGIQQKEKKQREESFTFPFFGCETLYYYDF
jgi:hypothetical protein